MIPKIIHQTYKTKTLTKQYKEYQKKLLKLHPDWEYKLWVDSENESFLKEIYPDYHDFYNAIPLKIIKFDFIRYVYLYHFGGLYLDLDYEMLKPFDLLHYDIVLPRESDDDKTLRLGNSFLASVPKHPFWEMVIQNLIANIHNTRGYIEEEDVITISGPGLITKTFLNLQDNCYNIYIPPRLQFNPPIPQNQEEYHRLVSANRCYGIHHCTGSWRALSVSQKVFKRIKKLFSCLSHSV